MHNIVVKLKLETARFRASVEIGVNGDTEAHSCGGRRCRPDAHHARSVDLISALRSRYFSQARIRLRAGAEEAIRPVHFRFLDADDRRRDAIFLIGKVYEQCPAAANGSATGSGIGKRGRQARAGTIGEAGVHGLLPKPFAINRLLQKVKECVPEIETIGLSSRTAQFSGVRLLQRAAFCLEPVTVMIAFNRKPGAAFRDEIGARSDLFVRRPHRNELAGCCFPGAAFFVLGFFAAGFRRDAFFARRTGTVRASQFQHLWIFSARFSAKLKSEFPATENFSQAVSRLVLKNRARSSSFRKCDTLFFAGYSRRSAVMVAATILQRHSL